MLKEFPLHLAERLPELGAPEDVHQEVSGGVDGESEVSQPGHLQDESRSILPADWGSSEDTIETQIVLAECYSGCP